MTAEAKALEALTDLATIARGAHREDIAETLDSARTRLTEEGPEYLDAAEAFIEAARKIISPEALDALDWEADAISLVAQQIIGGA